MKILSGVPSNSDAYHTECSPPLELSSKLQCMLGAPTCIHKATVWVFCAPL